MRALRGPVVRRAADEAERRIAGAAGHDNIMVAESGGKQEASAMKASKEGDFKDTCIFRRFQDALDPGGALAACLRYSLSIVREVAVIYRIGRGGTLLQCCISCCQVFRHCADAGSRHG